MFVVKESFLRMNHSCLLQVVPRSKGQKYKCFNGRAYLINKLLGDFPCEARLEMTINACILVDWFFQVQFPKKMKRDTNELKVQKRYLSGQPYCHPRPMPLSLLGICIIEGDVDTNRG